MKLRLGTKYRARNGVVVKIVAFEDDISEPYPYSDEKGVTYMRDGRYLTEPASHMDLVEEVPDPEEWYGAMLNGDPAYDLCGTPIPIESVGADHWVGNETKRRYEDYTLNAPPKVGDLIEAVLTGDPKAKQIAQYLKGEQYETE